MQDGDLFYTILHPDVIFISMDDNEYYSLMNRPSSWALQQALKNNQKSKQKTDKLKINQDNSYISLELRQGAADAQMLYEKNDKSGV